MRVEKDYGYIPDLQRAILRSRITSGRGMSRVRSQRPEDPRQYGLLCGVSPLSTEELWTRYLSVGVFFFFFSMNLF